MKVVITGASRGIGLATAITLRERGHDVIGLSRMAPPGDELSGWRRMDVSDPESVELVFDTLAQWWGPTDVLVCNAGAIIPGSVFEMTPELWRNQFATNLDGAFYCTRSFARQAMGRGGMIVYVSSTAATGPRPGRSAYAASKAALSSFALSMAEELRPYRIRVYLLHVGATDTELRDVIEPDEPRDMRLAPSEVGCIIANLIESGDLLDAQPITIKRG